jgi:hypothetical protein
VRPFHTSRLLSPSTIRMRFPLRSTRFSIGSRRCRSILKSLGSYQLHGGRMAAVTKKPLPVEVTPLFAGCEPNKRHFEARSRTTSNATPSTTWCGGVSMRIGFRQLARRATLFTTGNRHGIYLLGTGVPGPCAAALGVYIGRTGRNQPKTYKPFAEWRRSPTSLAANSHLFNELFLVQGGVPLGVRDASN